MTKVNMQPMIMVFWECSKLQYMLLSAQCCGDLPEMVHILFLIAAIMVPSIAIRYATTPQDPTVGWGRSGRAQRSTGGDSSDGELSGDDADGGRGGGGGADLGRESENEDADRWAQ